MNSFESKSAYAKFVGVVRSERRWIFDGEARHFLDVVRKVISQRVHPLKSGRQLWRCQRGSTLKMEATGEDEDQGKVEVEYPYASTRMIPEPQFVKVGGRANPPGFAYLYLATKPETAMAEMRPWVGESLSVALFEIQRDLRVVLCQDELEDPLERIFDENPSPERIDKYVWNDISRAFARPLNRDDLESAYVPTQILAEVFKAEGFDGIAYHSGLAQGTNVVLFDIQAAKLVQTYLYGLKKLRYTFVADDSRFTIHVKKDGGSQDLSEFTSESP